MMSSIGVFLLVALTVGYMQAAHVEWDKAARHTGERKVINIRQESDNTADAAADPATTEDDSAAAPATTGDGLTCMNCNAKHDFQCTDSRYNVSFTETCPKDSPGCYSSVKIKGTGHPFRTIKGCVELGASCTKNGYTINTRYYKRYCCLENNCNEGPMPPKK